MAGAPTFAYRIDDECGDAPGGREREDATDDDCPARVLPEAPERVRQVDHDSHRRPERLGIAVALRPSMTTRFLVTSGGDTIERDAPEPVGDMGDRVLAPVVALHGSGRSVPALEIGVRTLYRYLA